MEGLGDGQIPGQTFYIAVPHGDLLPQTLLGSHLKLRQLFWGFSRAINDQFSSESPMQIVGSRDTLATVLCQDYIFRIPVNAVLTGEKWA